MHVVASITHLCKEDVLILMKEVWWLFWGIMLNSFGAYGVPCAAWKAVNTSCIQLK